MKGVALALTTTAASGRQRTMERPSLAELFAANARFVWRVLASHGVREADVEDATQEVFLVAHRRMEDWDPARAAARTWLYAIAIRVAANQRRRAHLSREQPADEARHVSIAPDPDKAIDRERFLARLERAISALD